MSFAKAGLDEDVDFESVELGEPLVVAFFDDIEEIFEDEELELFDDDFDDDELLDFEVRATASWAFSMLGVDDFVLPAELELDLKLNLDFELELELEVVAFRDRVELNVLLEVGYAEGVVGCCIPLAMKLPSPFEVVD